MAKAWRNNLPSSKFFLANVTFEIFVLRVAFNMTFKVLPASEGRWANATSVTSRWGRNLAPVRWQWKRWHIFPECLILTSGAFRWSNFAKWGWYRREIPILSEERHKCPKTSSAGARRVEHDESAEADRSHDWVWGSQKNYSSKYCRLFYSRISERGKYQGGCFEEQLKDARLYTTKYLNAGLNLNLNLKYRTPELVTVWMDPHMCKYINLNHWSHTFKFNLNAQVHNSESESESSWRWPAQVPARVTCARHALCKFELGLELQLGDWTLGEPWKFKPWNFQCYSNAESFKNGSTWLNSTLECWYICTWNH